MYIPVTPKWDIEDPPWLAYKEEDGHTQDGFHAVFHETCRVQNFRKGGILTGHGKGRWCTNWVSAGKMVCQQDMGVMYHVILAGHGQLRWYTDWTWGIQMMYLLDI